MTSRFTLVLFALFLPPFVQASVGHLPGPDEDGTPSVRLNPEQYLDACERELRRARLAADFSRIPRLVILSESDHSAKAVQDFRRSWIREGIEGKLVLALEGATFENSGRLAERLAADVGLKVTTKARIVGLEREVSHALTGLLKLIQRYRPTVTVNLDFDQFERFNRQSLDLVLLPMMEMYSSLRVAWLDMIASPALPRRLAIHDAITQWARALEQGKTGKAERRAISACGTAYEIHLARTLEELAGTYAALIERKPSLRPGLALPDRFLEVVRECDRLAFVDPEILVVHWRNYSFIPSLDRAAKRAARERKPLVVLVGRAHVPFIQRYAARAYRLKPQVVSAEEG